MQALAITFLALCMFSPPHLFASTYGSGTYGDGTYGPSTSQETSPSTDTRYGGSQPQPPGCSASSPTSAPVIFQINQGINNHTLFFTPAQNADRYFISYGLKAGSYTYGVEVIRKSDGVIAVDIQSLGKNTQYFYRVRGGNGCATGDWSNELSAQTGKTAPVYRLTALTPAVRTKAQKEISAPSFQIEKVTAPEATLAPSPAPQQVASPIQVQSEAPSSKPTFGFWEFLKKLFGR